MYNIAIQIQIKGQGGRLAIFSTIKNKNKNKNLLQKLSSHASKKKKKKSTKKKPANKTAKVWVTKNRK